MKLYEKYIKDVEDGTRIAGKSEKLSVKRHLEWLEKSKDPNYPYYWDGAAVDRVIKFMSMLRLTGGTYLGKKWDVQPIQAFYFCCVYGWKKRSDNFRRIRKIYWCTARKSAKSEMTAGEEVYHLTADCEGNPQILNVATTRDQAGFVYDAANTMTRFLIKDSLKAKAKLRPMQYEIRNTDINEGGYITCLTAQSDKNDGGNPHFASVDEFHAHQDNSMLDIITTGTGMRDQPLVKITTTAGNNKDGPDFAFRKYCKSVLNGDIEDDTLFVMVCELDDEDDDDDETNWYKANPLLGITPKLDSIRADYTSAKNQGGEAWSQFLTKSLNKYVDSTGAWVSSDHYKAIINEKPIAELKGLKCIIGVDLASVEDTTAITYLFFPQPGLDNWYYFTKYYCPASKFKTTRVDGVLYKDFLKGGYMTNTGGKVTDRDVITKDILNFSNDFKIAMIAYDPHMAVDITKVLDERGFILAKVFQSYSNLGAGNQFWHKLMLSNKIECDNNPVTKWQMGNIEMTEDDRGLQKISKNKSKNKVDGPVSISNAFAGYIYWDREFKKELTAVDVAKALGSL